MFADQAWLPGPDPLVLLAAVALDLCFGDPPNRFHPVAWFGRAVSPWIRVEEPTSGTAARDFVRGIVLVLVSTLGFVALGCGIVALTRPWPLLSFVAQVLVLKSAFAIRGLGAAGSVTESALRRGNLEQARHSLRSLCSRDPSSLGPSEIAASAVESVAENASDSAVAPFLFYALGGLPGVLAYRAVNTLDAMVGYRGRFEFFGKAAARLDDVLNWIPARLCAALLLVVGRLRGADWLRGWAVMRRDAATTPSPNAGRPMAAMAGLLGVRLTKRGVYALGDPTRPTGPDEIAQAWNIARDAILATALLVCLALRLGASA
ncbi:MAG: adenosylcobinamide-phosphate synthase CbiB [Myxococcota bacterium]